MADDRKRPGTHRWISNPEAGLPAWIQAEWSRPREISEIEIVFDTGLHRALTFSLSDSHTSQMIWGRPAPETARDFSLECHAGDTWTTLCEVSDNGLRRWRHPLPAPLACDALRITVKRTWGNAEARIIRVSAH